jgi:hypothetical protein
MGLAYSKLLKLRMITQQAPRILGIILLHLLDGMGSRRVGKQNKNTDELMKRIEKFSIGFLCFHCLHKLDLIRLLLILYSICVNKISKQKSFSNIIQFIKEVEVDVEVEVEEEKLFQPYCVRLFIIISNISEKKRTALYNFKTIKLSNNENNNYIIFLKGGLSKL